MPSQAPGHLWTTHRRLPIPANRPPTPACCCSACREAAARPGATVHTQVSGASAGKGWRRAPPAAPRSSPWCPQSAPPCCKGSPRATLSMPETSQDQRRGQEKASPLVSESPPTCRDSPGIRPRWGEPAFPWDGAWRGSCWEDVSRGLGGARAPGGRFGQGLCQALPGAAGVADTQAADHVQQLVHEVQLLLGAGPALGREGHMHSLAQCARGPLLPQWASSSPRLPPGRFVDRFRAPSTTRQAVDVATSHPLICGQRGLVPP